MAGGQSLEHLRLCGAGKKTLVPWHRVNMPTPVIGCLHAEYENEIDAEKKPNALLLKSVARDLCPVEGLKYLEAGICCLSPRMTT